MICKKDEAWMREHHMFQCPVCEKFFWRADGVNVCALDEAGEVTECFVCEDCMCKMDNCFLTAPEEFEDIFYGLQKAVVCDTPVKPAVGGVWTFYTGGKDYVTVRITHVLEGVEGLKRGKSVVSFEKLEEV